MSQSNKDARIASLLIAAEEQSQLGNLQLASQRLREASYLDAENEDIRSALNRLQIASSGDDVDQQLEDYLATKQDATLEKLLQGLSKRDSLTHASAQRCLDAAFQQDYKQADWADIIVRLASGQREARKIIAARTTAEPDSIVELLVNTTDNASKAVFQVLFDATSWPGEDAQTTAQKAIFKKCISQQGEPQSRRAVELVLRQLILSPSTVATLADETLVARLLELLDVRQPQNMRGQALLATTKLFEAAEEKAETTFVRLITQYATSASSPEHVIAFSAAAALFPVVPTICARLLLTDGFVPGLVPLLQEPKITEIGKSDTSQVQRAILELLSAACVDKACREAILKHCQASLKALSKDSSTDNALLAALTLTKLSGSNTDPAVVKRLTNVLSHDSSSHLAIEGLAYASLKPSVKEQISKDDKLLKLFIASLGQQQHILSCLTILSNLTAYRPARSEEQKKMAQLKAYANSSKPVAEDPLDNNGMVSIRCKRLLDVGLIAALVARVRNFKTSTHLELIARILNSIARESKHRTKMVQEGAMKLLLNCHARLETLQSKDSTAAQRLVAHAIARVLISVNPAHVFNTALPATSAVSAILPLLEVDQEQEERDLLPTFEALLALTNLASMNDTAVCDLIIRKSWTQLEDQHLLSGNNLIQRASVELVCNLMLSPSGVAKFADGSDQAARRLHILLALADVDDLATRKAAGGALAMLTEWDTAVTAINKIANGTRILLSMCADSQDEMKHRGIICLLNCASMPDEAGAVSIANLKAQKGVLVIQDALKVTKSADVLAAGADLLKKLV